MLIKTSFVVEGHLNEVFNVDLTYIIDDISINKLRIISSQKIACMKTHSLYKSEELRAVAWVGLPHGTTISSSIFLKPFGSGAVTPSPAIYLFIHKKPSSTRKYCVKFTFATCLSVFQCCHEFSTCTFVPSKVHMSEVSF